MKVILQVVCNGANIHMQGFLIPGPQALDHVNILGPFQV